MLTAFHVLPRNIWWIYFYPGLTEALLAALLEFVVLPKRIPAGRRGNKDGDYDGPAMMTSSGGNKIEPGVASPPSSALVVAPQLASESGDDDEMSRSGVTSSAAKGPL